MKLGRLFRCVTPKKRHKLSKVIKNLPDQISLKSFAHSKSQDAKIETEFSDQAENASKDPCDVFMKDPAGALANGIQDQLRIEMTLIIKVLGSGLTVYQTVLELSNNSEASKRYFLPVDKFNEGLWKHLKEIRVDLRQFGVFHSQRTLESTYLANLNALPKSKSLLRCRLLTLDLNSKPGEPMNTHLWNTVDALTKTFSFDCLEVPEHRLVPEFRQILTQNRSFPPKFKVHFERSKKPEGVIDGILKKFSNSDKNLKEVYAKEKQRWEKLFNFWANGESGFEKEAKFEFGHLDEIGEGALAQVTHVKSGKMALLHFQMCSVQGDFSVEAKFEI